MIKFLIIFILGLSFFSLACSDEPTGDTKCEIASDCEDSEICTRDKTCKKQICPAGTRACMSENSYQQCSLDGTELSAEITCPTNQLCDNGLCVDTACNADDFVCIKTDVTETSYKECTQNGYWSESKICPDGEICIDELKGCGNKTCNPNEVRCLTDNGIEEQRCNDSGTAWLSPTTCLGADASCSLSNGCIEGECTPDERVCYSSTSYQVCNEGVLSEAINCEASSASGELTQCDGGVCKDECLIAAAKRSYMGCEYYAVDLDNTGGIFRNDEAQTPHYFAIIISNPSAYTAEVTISDNTGNISTRSVASNAVEIFEMDTLHYDGYFDRGGKWYYEWTDTHQIIGTNKGTNFSYKIKSDLPIIAYQFSPLGGSTNYSNDASMLIPITAYDTEYRMLSWEHWNSSSQTMTIVAKEDNTTVSIDFKATTKGENSIAEQATGSSQTYTLSTGETIQFASKSGDLSGSYINADKAVGVFAGHSCTNIPNDKTACDHIEEQLFPLNTWGSHYVVVKTKVRGGETEYYKIVTSEPETRLTFNPGINVGLTNPLTGMTVHGAGETTIFSTKDSFELTTDKPVSIGQFITSQNDVSNNPLSPGIGDPAFILQVPVEQFRASYLFLTPSTYDENYITIVAPPTFDGLVPTVTLDSEIVPSGNFTSIGNYYYARESLESGTHSIVSTYPVGISIYGWSDYVSYGYPGGLDLRNIKGQ